MLILAGAWAAYSIGRAHAQPHADSANDSGAATVASQPAQPAGSRLAQARSHFVLGTRFFEARNYRDALREFELVANLAPSADIWFDIGRAHEELGEYDRAARALARYLHDRVDAKDQAAVQIRIVRLERLAEQSRQQRATAPDSGSLRIHTRSTTAHVLVDGQPVAGDALHEPLLLPAGRHRLDVSDAQHVPLHAQFDIAPGLLTAAYADLQPRTRVRTLAPARIFSWTFVGLTIAGATVSAAFGGIALAQQVQGDLPRAYDWGQRTDVALVSTAVCALAAAVVYGIEGRSARTELRTAR